MAIRLLLCGWESGTQKGKYLKNFKQIPPRNVRIKTSSGHLIVLNDANGEESVEIKDKNSNEILMTGEGITIQVSSGAKIEITSSGIVIDTGSLPIKAKSLGEINLDSPKVNLGSSAGLAVARISDQGIGNLGAPVVITSSGSQNAFA